jgi:pimeloyl-ACP methyl ester carboxylesterase
VSKSPPSRRSPSRRPRLWMLSLKLQGPPSISTATRTADSVHLVQRPSRRTSTCLCSTKAGLLAAFKAAPSWPGLAAAHTITRERRAEAEAKLDPALTARITVPTLLFTGEHSSDLCKGQIEAVAAALPSARIVVIQGQEHVADVFAPPVIVGPSDAAPCLSWSRTATTGR